ncbi:universal stress protein [Streptomyces argenteolus]|uniref:universal stress protein n=1 Tax=Streptomyces sp. NPDC025273 TaxID=3155251 RepID=UPI00337EAE64
MTGTVAVGMDGSPESFTAVEWAAREAVLRELPVHVVHVRESPEVAVPAPLPPKDERLLREASRGAGSGRPGMAVHTGRLIAHHLAGALPARAGTPGEVRPGRSPAGACGACGDPSRHVSRGRGPSGVRRSSDVGSLS